MWDLASQYDEVWVRTIRQTLAKVDMQEMAMASSGHTNIKNETYQETYSRRKGEENE